ncbi:uncharacterized protein SAMN06265795_11644 [Noviherbaspirillum humi]|uniref:DUF418 domain-containing protein n=1 Tax=Noviherbaspirillum humi TaxID=1688639 RepID=A0A239KJA0_9BURK|nr:DUF418 domain-containing protein [Noviherbaspirillum humi]SNT18457.1 uncharacterized protein SAMN06265795_11644 [Noviherbaspirillum humi]
MSSTEGRPAASPPQAPRASQLDAVRGMALFGILLVNVWSFLWGFGYLRFGLMPESPSLADRGAVFLVALLAEQKFYPVFAFLFGAGFALQTRSMRRRFPAWQTVRQQYSRRLRWLLGCGILHGTLIWAGDILTIYGLVGFLVLGMAGAKLKTIAINLWNWSVVWLAAIAVNLALALTPYPEQDVRHQAQEMVQDIAATHDIYTAGTLAEQALQRLADYADVTSRSIFLVPHLLVLFLLGMLAARLGWLTRPRRHAALWRRMRAVGFGVGIPFNLLWAAAALAEAMDPLAPPHVVLALYALLPAGGSFLAAGYVASLMLAGDRASSRLSAWLSPAGRMSLTNYLMQSLLGVLLFQGVGLGLGRSATSPAVVLAQAFAIIAFQIAFSRWWLGHHSRGPMEALDRRRRATIWPRPPGG